MLTEEQILKVYELSSLVDSPFVEFDYKKKCVEHWLKADNLSMHQADYLRAQGVSLENKYATQFRKEGSVEDVVRKLKEYVMTNAPLDWLGTGGVGYDEKAEERKFWAEWDNVTPQFPAYGGGEDWNKVDLWCMQAGNKVIPEIHIDVDQYRKWHEAYIAHLKENYIVYKKQQS